MQNYHNRLLVPGDFCLLGLSIILGFPYGQPCHLQIRTVLYLPFPVCVPFISFSYLTELAITSSMIWKQWEQYPHLIYNLNGKASSLSSLSMMLVVDSLSQLEVSFLVYLEFLYDGCWLSRTFYLAKLELLHIEHQLPIPFSP